MAPTRMTLLPWSRQLLLLTLRCPLLLRCCPPVLYS